MPGPAAASLGGALARLRDRLPAGPDRSELLLRLAAWLFAVDAGLVEPAPLGATGRPLAGAALEAALVRAASELSDRPGLAGGITAGAAAPDLGPEAADALRAASAIPWDVSSPALLGSLIQEGMHPGRRREAGAHYTPDADILRALGPLVLDALRAEGAAVAPGEEAAFAARLGGLRFLDPACGAGDFLCVALRELRGLEARALGGRSGPSAVRLDSFVGIELDPLAARAAAAALAMVDRLSGGSSEAADGAPGVHVGNALAMDWRALLPPGEGRFVVGNPPFVGKHLRTPTQTADLKRVFGGGGASLDYAAGWFLTAARWARGSAARCAFVATNSVTQGEQVAPLWRAMHAEGATIHFAWRGFPWTGVGGASVHVVVLGFGPPRAGPALLLEVGEPPRAVPRISPYLVAGPDRIVEGRARPLAAVPPIRYGSKPVDGGALLFTRPERDAFAAEHPAAEPWLRPLVSAREYLEGGERFCLWLAGVPEASWRRVPGVVQRVEQVRAFRLRSSKAPTRAAATRASEFAEIRQPSGTFVVVPMHTSGSRSWVPLGFFGPETVVHNSCTCVDGAGRYHFGVLSSAMHMAWLGAVGGRLGAGYRYSNRLVYNTFPWPAADAAQRAGVEAAADAVLEARRRDERPLAAAYDPDRMTAALFDAHQALDRAVDRLYRDRPFGGERDRLEVLFAAYAEGGG